MKVREFVIIKITNYYYVTNNNKQNRADPEAVKEATYDVYDAEKEKEQLEREKEQQEFINSLEKEKDDNQLEIDLNNQLLEKIERQIDEIINETHSLEEWLKIISEQNLPMLNDVFNGVNDNLTKLLQNLGTDTGLLGDITTKTSDAIKQGILNGTLDPEYWAEKVGWIKGDGRAFLCARR